MSNTIQFGPNIAVDSNNDGVNGAVATFFDTGTSSPQTVYTDKALTAGVTSLTADSEGVFAPVYSADVTDLKVVVKTSGGSTISTTDPAPVHSVGGGASSVGFTPITGNTATDVQTAIANNTEYALIGENARQIVTTAGTSTAYTYTSPNPITAYAVGQSILLDPHATSGASPTINVDGLGAVAIKYINTSGTETAVGVGNIQIHTITKLAYDGTDFIIDYGLSSVLGQPVLNKLLDEDDMASDSNSSGATQQSIKAYVDNLTPTITADVEPSGTSEAGFTGLPATITKIEVTGTFVSVSGTDELLIQLGDAGGYETASYNSTCSVLGGGGGSTNSTAGFIITHATAATKSYHFCIHLRKNKGNRWVISGNTYDQSTSENMAPGGQKATSAQPDRVRVVPSGSDTFDDGSISIIYN